MEMSQEMKFHGEEVIKKIQDQNNLPKEEIIKVIDEFLEHMPESPFELHKMIVDKYLHVNNGDKEYMKNKILGNAIEIQNYFSDELKLADRVMDKNWVGHNIKLNDAGIIAQKKKSISKYNAYLNRKEFYDKIESFGKRYGWFIAGVLVILGWGVNFLLKDSTKDKTKQELKTIDKISDKSVPPLHQATQTDSLKKLKDDTLHK